MRTLSQTVITELVSALQAQHIITAAVLLDREPTLRTTLCVFGQPFGGTLVDGLRGVLLDPVLVLLTTERFVPSVAAQETEHCLTNTLHVLKAVLFDANRVKTVPIRTPLQKRVLLHKTVANQTLVFVASLLVTNYGQQIVVVDNIGTVIAGTCDPLIAGPVADVSADVLVPTVNT